MMWLGVDYYPEQWDPGRMEEDLDTIVDLGCNVIRIAEFAWHRMEQSEGAYDFSFFDGAIAQAKRRGLKVILGTPTAAIPAWLARKRPDILSEFEGGRRRAFGGRHVCCYNSPALYEYSEKIIRRMVEHYRDEEAVIAWQADNELGHEGSDLCWCPRCRSAFRKYLEEKFRGDIEALNETYGTAFWSQEYNCFEEIPLPEETITTHNPALRLDWERFRSKSIGDFLAFQVRLIKETAPGAVVIHDFPGGGLDKHVDYAAAARPLDIAAYNNYPVWGGQKAPLPPHAIAFELDYIRGLKRRNFWITEAIMGAQGHDVTGYLPRPGQAKLWSYQAMAHGCEAMLYFRFRGAAKGAEQFCYGILDADNRRGRKFAEVQSFFADIRQYEKAMTAPARSEVAIVYDYDSLAAFRIQRQSILLDCHEEMKKLYKLFYDRNVPVDVIPAEADLRGYKVVILPQLLLVKPAFQARVRAFAEGGGTLVLTYRTAVKDEDNNLPIGEAPPVGFRELAGVTVEETESLQEAEAFSLLGQGDFAGREGRGGIFRDMLSVQDAEILYRYGDAFYEDRAAVTRRRQGAGSVYYLGCGLDEGTAAGLAEAILKERGIETLSSPEGVEIVDRGAGEDAVRLYLNHNGHAVFAGGKELAAYGCRIERRAAPRT